MIDSHGRITVGLDQADALILMKALRLAALVLNDRTAALAAQRAAGALDYMTEGRRQPGDFRELELL